MRHSVMLDPDVYDLVRETMERRGVSFKEAINEGLRLGLTEPDDEDSGYTTAEP